MTIELGLVGKVAIVTGASRGIGAAVATALAAEGVDVALIARHEGRLVALATDIEARYHVRAVPITVDLTQPDEISEGIARAAAALGRVDVLINGAGASPFGSLDSVTDDEWVQAFSLKVLGYVRTTRAVLPFMRRQHSGAIINIVGMAGRYATPNYVLGALNAALLHVTTAVSALVAEDGIRVLAVNPSLTATERSLRALDTWAMEAGEDSDDYRHKYVRSLPLGRLAEPAEVAAVVVIAASDVARYMTGSALQVDGGSPKGVF